MAIDNQLIDALSDCIDRLNQGEARETILRDYPEMASQLAPMLEAGLVTSKARYPVTDVTSAQEKLSPQIQSAIDTTFGGGSISSAWLGWIVVLIIAGGILAGIVSLNRGDTTEVAITATTVNDTPTVSPQPTAEPTMDVLTIIEGPVSRIQGAIITIYEQAIQLEASDPRLAVMQLGDVLRIETTQEGQSMLAVEITFVNVLVIVNDSGQIWRGDDCTMPPPEWVTDDISVWLIQCGGNQNQPSSNPSGGNDDDDDDDD